jgi:hypothetical protein
VRPLSQAKLPRGIEVDPQDQLYVKKKKKKSGDGRRRDSTWRQAGTRAPLQIRGWRVYGALARAL